MADKVLGVDVLISIGGQTVGGQNDCSLTISTKEIDTSDKTTGGWDTSQAGNRSWSVSMKAALIVGDAGQSAIKTACKNGDPVTLLITEGGAGTDTGTAIIASYKVNGSKDDVASMEIDFKGNSALTIA